MAWSNGMELVNGSGNIAFAEHQNQQMMAARGNYVLSGLTVSANVSSDLETTQVDVDISNGFCFNDDTHRELTSIPSIDLSTAYSGLSTGQSRYVFIYVNTSGTVVSGVAGTVATTGQQLPPDIVESTVVLAMITLTYLDTTVDSADIEDWRIFGPTVDLLNLMGISSYVHIIMAHIMYGKTDTPSDGGFFVSPPGGIRSEAIGASSICLTVMPPDWLVRYCVEQSKTLKVTTITCNWESGETDSYLTDQSVVIPDLYDFSNVSIYSSSTDLGNGTTGTRSDVFNVTDTAIVEGEGIAINLFFQQTTVANKIYIKSFEITYTIT